MPRTNNMEAAEAEDWRAVYSASADDSDTDPLPLMAHQDATAGPLIAPYLATEPSIVVKVRACYVGSALKVLQYRSSKWCAALQALGSPEGARAGADVHLPARHHPRHDRHHG